MHEPLTLVLALVTGVLLGAMFFGGLWWTVQKGVASTRSALWFFGSLWLRTSMALAGFYWYRARSLGEAAGVPPWICHGAPSRDVAHPSGGKANVPGTGGQPCALVPTR